MSHSLAALGLTSEELSSLASQGFISCESRGTGRVYFKLRFRRHGKQMVRYLGNDPATADEVRRELGELQAKTTAKRELSRLHRESQRVMRRVKKSLAPLVHEMGLSYHGYTLRRRRSQRFDPAAQSTAKCPQRSPHEFRSHETNSVTSPSAPISKDSQL